jgi:hypothetical protein
MSPILGNWSRRITEKNYHSMIKADDIAARIGEKYNKLKVATFSLPDEAPVQDKFITTCQTEITFWRYRDKRKEL